jgi:hypothetical protein
MSTTFDLPAALEEFAKDVGNAHSAYWAFAHWGAQGRLGELAKELAAFAETVSKSRYVPPAKYAEVQKFEKAADAATDRGVARYYREKARQARSQMGEVK